MFVVEADFPFVRLDLERAEQGAQFLPPALAVPTDERAVEVADQPLESGLEAPGE